MRQRLTFANVTSVIALFVALGGSSYAAVKIDGKQIKNGTITGAKIKRGSLKAMHFKAGQLPVGARGRAGARGATGAMGPRGLIGPAGATNVRYRFVDQAVPANNSVSATAECKPGERLTGGGSYTSNLLYSDTTEFNGYPEQPPQPDAPPTKWTGGVFNDSADTDGVLRVFAICAAP
jgi:hypothetical protein